MIIFILDFNILTINLKIMDKKTRNKEIGEEWKDHTQVYPDGSNQSNGFANAFYIYEKRQIN